MNHFKQLVFLSICCCSISLTAMTFKNTLDQKITVQTFCWVVNYLGSDPYQKLYSTKKIKDPCDILGKGNRAFAFLQLLPSYIEPYGVKIIEKVGFANLHIVVDDVQELKKEACVRMINTWMNRSFKCTLTAPEPLKILSCESLQIITKKKKDLFGAYVIYEITHFKS